MALAGFLLANSKKLVIGSSIANIYARDAFTARRGLATLNALHGGRFALGLGVSHIPMVEGLRGHRYEKPIPAMRGYLDGLRKAGGDALDGAFGQRGRWRRALQCDAGTHRAGRGNSWPGQGAGG
jgi:alkanesulfonate monooxygenase SsuD/methylene tetrahydromethanopterin reductase-like flavin-dependent oxidoreductase (luciferase family)